jgi:general secretion pathway protein H
VRLAFRREVDSRRFVLIDSAAPAASRDGFAPPPDANAGVLAEYPVPNAGDLEVTFLSTQKGGNTILLGGVLVETTTVPYATFYTDGTCSPFRAQFMKNAAVHIISIDPWTCAPMLKPVDPNAP